VISRDTNDEAWELACQCFDLLPPENLTVTGIALVHMVAVWLRAFSDDARAGAYMTWLDTLHHQLTENEILKIRTELIEGQATAAVH
jgi:hypothetical protein